MAYAFSSALEKMAQQVKKWLPIPLFTNAWIQKEGKKPASILVVVPPKPCCLSGKKLQQV
jgi:hypothetical protein